MNSNAMMNENEIENAEKISDSTNDTPIVPHEGDSTGACKSDSTPRAKPSCANVAPRAPMASATNKTPYRQEESATKDTSVSTTEQKRSEVRPDTKEEASSNTQNTSAKNETLPIAPTEKKTNEAESTKSGAPSKSPGMNTRETSLVTTTAQSTNGTPTPQRTSESIDKPSAQKRRRKPRKDVCTQEGMLETPPSDVENAPKVKNDTPAREMNATGGASNIPASGTNGTLCGPTTGVQNGNASSSRPGTGGDKIPAGCGGPNTPNRPKPESKKNSPKGQRRAQNTSAGVSRIPGGSNGAKKNPPATPGNGGARKNPPATPSSTGGARKNPPATPSSTGGATPSSTGGARKNPPATPSNGGARKNPPATPSNGDARKNPPATPSNSNGGARKNPSVTPSSNDGARKNPPATPSNSNGGARKNPPTTPSNDGARKNPPATPSNSNGGVRKNPPTTPSNDGARKNPPTTPSYGGAKKNPPATPSNGGARKNPPATPSSNGGARKNPPATPSSNGGARKNPPATRSSPRRRRQRTKKNSLRDTQAAKDTSNTAVGSIHPIVTASTRAKEQQQVGVAREQQVGVAREQQVGVAREQQPVGVASYREQQPVGVASYREQQLVVVRDTRLADVCRLLREVELHLEQHPDGTDGISVLGPEDCGEIRVGMEMTATFTAINSLDEDRVLESYGAVIPNPSILALSPCPCTVPGRSGSTEVIVSLKGSSPQLLHNYLFFAFDGGLKLYCRIHLTVTSDVVESLVPDGVYEPRRRPPGDYIDRLSDAVEGVKPPCPQPSFPMPESLCFFDVPRQLRTSPARFCLPHLMKPLTLDTYSNRFDVLLWLEELGKEGDVRQYDMFSVTLEHAEDSYLSLDVPGLAKRKQPVVRGDKLIFSACKPDPADQPLIEGDVPEQQVWLPFARYGEHYSAYVHKVDLRQEQLMLKFKPWFHESEELCSKQYDVMFTVNRVTLIRMHQALDMTEAIGAQILFPSTKPPSPSLECAPFSLQYINTRLNPRQRCAVEAIVSAACRPIPYILFGPPGTGKTVTMVESILQVYKRDTSCKILACAPSNSAADLLAERLHDSGHMEKVSMVRLNAVMRSKPVLRSIEKYCITANDDRAWDMVTRSRIIVCTCSTAAKLSSMGMVFSYVFVDEAGEALEPECLIPVSLLARGRGQLVLAGDPLQLGPVIFSSLASDNGLSISMLERLMGRDLYRRDATVFAATGNYDSMVVTKLIENYRSHGTLLQLYSDQFYNGELVERADRRITHSLCNWEHLPTRGIPLLFHGIQGAEKRERGSPSWFNAFEAEQVLIYAKNLVLQRSLRQEDIGVIAPYNRQVEKIRLLLDREGLRDVKVGSVEEFQGRENLVIIISTVRSSSTFLLEDVKKQLGFVSNPKRFNVAISRAQALLIVVGNPHLLAQDPCWSKLIQYARDNHCYTGCPLL